MADPVSSVVTPSGVAIEYFIKPHRHYMVSAPDTPTEWHEVPSVTTVLEVLDKPALPWWGMKIGAEGVSTLIDLGILVQALDGARRGLMLAGNHAIVVKRSDGDVTIEPGKLLETDELVHLLNKFKLTVNHVKSEAADRGTGVHDALEAWGAVGKLPDPNEHGYEEKGYITALRAFLIDAQAGKLEAEKIEVAVASFEHGYAGRFDLLANTHEPMRVVTKVFPKWAPKHTVVPPGRGLIDLKTSKDIYVTHHIQLAGYEGALIEDGYGSTDWRAVLHVQADGRYEFRRSRASHQDFLDVLAAHHALVRVKESMKL